MNHFLKPLGVLLVLGALAAAAAEKRFKLPPETAKLKPGSGADLANVNCLLCHSADYISTQPRLDRPGWQSEVLKMRDKYGAPIQTNRVDALVDYLVANYGKVVEKK